MSPTYLSMHVQSSGIMIFFSVFPIVPIPQYNDLLDCLDQDFILGLVRKIGHSSLISWYGLSDVSQKLHTTKRNTTRTKKIHTYNGRRHCPIWPLMAKKKPLISATDDILASNVGDMSAAWRNVTYFCPDRANLATWFLVCRHTFVSQFSDIDVPRTDKIQLSMLLIPTSNVDLHNHTPH